jgi:hypothetical protein
MFILKKYDACYKFKNFIEMAKGINSLIPCPSPKGEGRPFHINLRKRFDNISLYFHERAEYD